MGCGRRPRYAKDVRASFADPTILPLYDVINLHTYAQVPRRPGASPWTRSYPEDPGIACLDEVDAAIAWRAAHAPEKAVWVTEFGYDACAPAAMARRSGWAARLDALPGIPARVSGLVTGSGAASEPEWRVAGETAITLQISESPCYLVFE